MTISVVIPTIPERGPLLARALASVTAQTLLPDEVCIAVARDGEPGWRTRNRALAMATSEWVAFLDDDDEFLPRNLERCAAHQQATDADLVYPWFEVAGGTDPFDHFGQPWDHASPVQTTVVTFARREAVLAVGGFSFDDGEERHDHGGNRAGEDFEMVQRLNAAGCRISHLAERTWIWHHHFGNTMGLPERRPSVVHSEV